MTFDRPAVVHALKELSDRDYQELVWMGKDPNRMSSFIECVERLFDDSGLDRVLRTGAAFTPEIDEQLRHLSRLVDEIDEYQPDDQLLRDPKLLESRVVSARVLGLLERPQPS